MSKLVQDKDSFEGTSKSSLTLDSKSTSSSVSEENPDNSKITRDLDFYDKLHKLKRDSSNSEESSDDDDEGSSTSYSTISTSISRGWMKNKNKNLKKNTVFIGESNYFSWDKLTTEWKFLNRGMVEIFLDDSNRAYLTVVISKKGGKKIKVIMEQNLSPYVNLRVSKRSRRVIVWNGSPQIGPENDWKMEKMTEYAFQFNTKIKAKIFLEKLEKWKKLQKLTVQDDVQVVQDVQDIQNDESEKSDENPTWTVPVIVDSDNNLTNFAESFENVFKSTGELPETQSLVVLTGSRPASASPSQTSLHHIEYLSSVHSRKTKIGHIGEMFTSQSSSETSVESKCDLQCDNLPTLLMEVTLDGDFDCEKCKKKLGKGHSSSSCSSIEESVGSDNSQETSSSDSSSDEDSNSSDGIVARVSPTDFRDKSLIDLMNKFNLKPSADDEEDDIVIDDDQNEVKVGEDLIKSQISGKNQQNLVNLKKGNETDLNLNEIMNSNSNQNSSKVPATFNLFVPELAKKCQIFIWNPVHRSWTEYFSGKFEFINKKLIGKYLIKMIGFGFENNNEKEKEIFHQLNPSKEIILLEKVSKCFVLLYNALDYSNENYFKDTKFSLVIPKHDPESSKLFQNMKPQFEDFKQTKKVSGPRYNVTIFHKEPENSQPLENDQEEEKIIKNDEIVQNLEKVQENDEKLTKMKSKIIKNDEIVQNLEKVQGNDEKLTKMKSKIIKNDEIVQNLEKVQENDEKMTKMKSEFELGFKVKLAFVDFNMSVDYNELLAAQKDGKLILSYDPADVHPKLTYLFDDGQPMSHFITPDTKFWISGPNLGTWISPRFPNVTRVRFLATFPDDLVLNLFSYTMNACSEKAKLHEDKARTLKQNFQSN